MGMLTADWGDFVNGVNARIDEVIDETQDLSPSFLGSGLFEKVSNPDGLIYRTNGVTGLKNLEIFDEGDSIKEDQTYPAYQTEYVMKQKGTIVTISQMLMKTRPSELEQKLAEVKQLMVAANRSLTEWGWRVLADGFSTTDSNANLPISRLDDAVSLFSTAHPSKVPGVANRTNRVASNPALSESNLFTAINLVREQLNGRGLPVGYQGDFTLVVPSALGKLAREITGSIQRSGTANNDLNVFTGGFCDVIDTNYLGNAANGITNADTSWYVFAKSPVEGPAMKYVSLIDPKIEREVDFDTKAIRVSVDLSAAMGYSAFEFSAASDGSGV